MSAPERRIPQDCGAAQARFHARWGHLRDPHVRDLAWLLGAPDLLDPAFPAWRGKIAALGPGAAQEAAAWLDALEREPRPLAAFLDIGPFERLGRYAEKLLAFYFAHLGILAAYGLQVSAGKGETVGEFDFLLKQGGEGAGTLAHREFATKFYLLAPPEEDTPVGYFIGPSLADTLQAKMRKILDRQLALSAHPAAAAVLPGRVHDARALVKGWLFYPAGMDVAAAHAAAVAGVAADHCRGFWCARDRFVPDPGRRYLPLPRLRWLSPARAPCAETLDAATAAALLDAHFAAQDAPLLLAVMADGEDGTGDWLECGRGFIVPADWRARALSRLGAEGGGAG